MLVPLMCQGELGGDAVGELRSGGNRGTSTFHQSGVDARARQLTWDRLD